MSWPKIFRRIFANDGAGPQLRQDILPSIPASLLPAIPANLLPLATTNARGAMPPVGGVGQFLGVNNAGTQAQFRSIDLSSYATQTQLNTHSALAAAHGAVSVATPNTMLLRDANGRVKVAAGSVAADVVNKGQLDAAISGAVYTTSSWKSSDGTSWYRKYSGGWIEQGGEVTFSGAGTITYPTPFTSVPLYFNAHVISSNARILKVNWSSTTKTTAAVISISSGDGSNSSGTFKWEAKGY